LSNLEELILRNVPIGNQLNNLQGLDNLYRLNLRNCGIRELAPLAELMVSGALQDDPQNGIITLVDIRDNPLEGSSTVYAPVRPFWHDIHIHYPIELPGNSLAVPEFSVPAGFYTEPFSLALSTNEEGAEIYYTLDGTTPTGESLLYSTPITITSRKDASNLISMIQTNQKDWERPEGEVFKATIIRVRVIDEVGQSVSPAVTHT